MVTIFSNYIFDFVVTEVDEMSSNNQMTTNDEHIINQINEGDTKAFAILVERYKDLVFTLTIRMLKNREEAEEVSQDTFIKVYKSLAKFKGESKFSTWIYRVAYNTCLDRLKKNKRQLNEVAIDEFTEHKLKTLDDALEHLEKHEQQRAIQDCLQQLPSDDSFILTLFYFEDLSLDEISKIVSIDANTVKVRLFRSRKRLATILRKKLEPEIISSYERERR
ncbi:MAG TPA: sigma-70 family RNA polymerase sigma factor [Aquaticitalea sp.]|nr:sigma-70 family RNA polymerase sigma factor [Aquaticitalea sp.]